MAHSFSRPDPTSPASVSSAQFPTSRRGYDQAEVRDFLRMVAAEQARLQERERALERELRAVQQAKPANEPVIDEETATRLLGEEAARLLQTARESAAQIRARAEEGSARLLREATDEAQRLREEAEIEAARRRQDASADSEAEIQMAKQQGRDMVNEARAYRERVLSELARRRELARQQIEQLIHGRDRLLQAFERSRIAAVDVMAELTPLGEPSEFVNLSPTTGPVPIMVPNNRPMQIIEPEPVDEPGVDDTQHAPRYISGDDTAMYDVEAEEPDDEPTAEVLVIESDAVDVTVVVVAEEIAIAVETATDHVELHIVEADRENIIDDDADGDRDHDDTVLSMPEAAPVQHHADDDDREPAPVVSLFNTELDPEPATIEPATIEPIDETAADDTVADETAADETTAEEPAVATPAVVDGLFAKLRAARAEAIAQRVAAEIAEHEQSLADDAAALSSTAPSAGDLRIVGDELDPPLGAADVAFLDEEPESTQSAAAVDELLVPLIVSAARKLKRVLADEQNEVLDTLRRKEPVRAIDTLLPWESEQSDRYSKAVEPDLVAASLAGAQGGDDGKNPAIVRPATDAVTNDIVAPLRERLTRCIDKAAGNNVELANQVRSLYREWKTQRIDEHVEDIVRLAYDRGALTVASR